MITSGTLPTRPVWVASDDVSTRCGLVAGPAERRRWPAAPALGTRSRPIRPPPVSLATSDQPGPTPASPRRRHPRRRPRRRRPARAPTRDHADPGAATGRVRRPRGPARHRSAGRRHRPARGDLEELRPGGRPGRAPAGPARLRRAAPNGSGCRPATPGARRSGPGTSRNVIADPPGFDDDEPHVVVVAHLDTVPVAPGAEDNASGVSVLLELARMAAAEPPDLPVRFIAFGAEEPRGSGDALHHFGSQQHVAELSRAERAGDPGGGRPGPGRRPGRLRAGLLGPSERQRPAAGRPRRRPKQVDVPDPRLRRQHDQRPLVVREGRHPGRSGWAASRTPATTRRGDTPEVVDRRQLDRVGTLMWTWLQLAVSRASVAGGVRPAAGRPDVVEDPLRPGRR